MWHLMQGDVMRLKSARTPHLHVYDGDSQALKDELRKEGLGDFIELDGSKMTTIDDFYDEFAAKLRFPDYFGRNLGALWDCMTDLAWLDADHYLLVVKDSDRILESEDKELAPILVEYLKDAGIEWAIPISKGEQEWCHDSIPFNAVLHVGTDQSRQQLEHLLNEEAGARYWDSLNSAWNMSK
jgi:RNAse (barnase) inhibitor barstar